MVRVGAAIHSVRAVDPERRGGRRVVGDGARWRRCTRTSPSSRPRTRQCVARLRGDADRRARARAGALSRAIHRRARDPRVRRTTSRCSAAPARAAACARRPSATSPTGSARRRRCCDAGCAADARQRLERDHRAVRGGARGRARRAAGDRRARLARRRTSCSAPRPPTATRASAGAQGGAIRAGDACRPRGGSHSTACASPAPATRTWWTRSCSRARPPTSATCVVGGRIVVRDGRHVAIDVPRRAGRGDQGGGVVSTVAIDNIGLLVTNDPELGDGPTGDRPRRRARRRGREGRGDRARRRGRRRARSTPAGAA